MEMAGNAKPWKRLGVILVFIFNVLQRKYSIWLFPSYEHDITEHRVGEKCAEASHCMCFCQTDALDINNLYSRKFKMQ